MINSAYKIWIGLFILINLTLFFWSLDLFNYFENNNINKENINIIKPEQEFKKSLPPKDESFPNEKSKVWSAFEDNKNFKQVIKEDSLLENNIKKNDSGKEVEDDLLKKEKIKLDENSTSKEKAVNNKSSLKNSEKKSTNANNIKKKELKPNNIESLFFYVQIASLSKQDLVQKEWKRLKSKYSTNMKDLIYISQEANLKDNRTFYRLLVGKFKNKNMAKIFCKKLNIKTNCIIKKISE